MTRTKTRALANWPNNAVSVLDFGATGDGVTDDTAAIQAALNSNEGAVSFPPGTYLTTAALNVSANTSIRGSNRGSTIIKAEHPSGSSVFYLDNVSNIVVSDLTANLNVVSGGGSVTFMTMGGAEVSEIIVENCAVNGSIDGNGKASYNGIKLSDGTTSSHCTFSKLDISKVNFAYYTNDTYGASDEVCDQWLFEKCYFSEVTKGITFNANFDVNGGNADCISNCSIIDCTFIGTTPDYDRCNSAGGDCSKNLTVSECTFIGRRGTGGSLAVEQHSEGTIFTNNTIFDCDGGIQVRWGGNRKVITGNIITLDPSVVSTPPPGKTLFNPQDHTGIYISATTYNGVSKEILISNNIITGAKAGIVFTGVADSTSTVSDNIIKFCEVGLSSRFETLRCSVNNNHIESCGVGYESASGNSTTTINYGGFNTSFIDCTVPLISYYPFSKVVLDSPRFARAFNSGGGGITERIPVCAIPALCDVDCAVVLETLTGDSYFATSTNLIISKSTVGPLFEADRRGRYEKGDFQMTTPILQENGGDLKVLYTLSGSALVKNQAYVTFTGQVFYDLPQSPNPT